MNQIQSELHRRLLLNLSQFSVQCQEQPFDGLKVLKQLVKKQKENNRNGKYTDRALKGS